MAFGFQVFNAEGQLIVDITDRLTRIIGSVETGTTPGSITVPNWTSFGTPWVYVHQRNNVSSTLTRGIRYVRPTISGNTLSWDFEPSHPNFSDWPRLAGTIIYGVY